MRKVVTEKFDRQTLVNYKKLHYLKIVCSPSNGIYIGRLNEKISHAYNFTNQTFKIHHRKYRKYSIIKKYKTNNTRLWGGGES